MTKFEQYITELGFVRHKSIGDELIPTEEYIYSTLANLDYTYILGDRQIRFGLSEHGKPPTIISPIPKYYILPKDGDGFLYISGDDYVNKCLQLFTPKEVYEAMFDRDSILELREE